MRRIIFLLLMISTMSYAQTKDFHSLTSLWIEYKEAESNDRPQQALKTLEKIRKKAENKQLSWDYYDAGQKYIELVGSTNWKQREHTMKQIREEIVRYNEPIVLFFDSYINGYPVANDMEFVNNNRERLEKGHHPAFYHNDPRISRFVFGSALAAIIENDYDYCLWCLYSVDYASANTNILKRHFNSRYPFDALIELNELELNEHKDYEKKYADKALSLFSTQRLLSERFDSLSKVGGKQDDYLELKKDVQSTIKKINSFSGNEKLFAQCCKYPSNILKQLEGSSIHCSVEDGVLIALLRNSNYVNINVKDNNGRSLIKEKLNNTANSYYVIDTLRYNLDKKLVDGEYTIEYGTNKTSILEYSKYSLSIALRSNSDGQGVFVADYKTGEPVKSCKLILYDYLDKIIAESSEITIDGFSSIPKTFLSKIEKNSVNYYIQAITIDYQSNTLLSPKQSINNRHSESPELIKNENSILSAVIISDRAAYNPGDTLYFKSILYNNIDHTIASSGLTVEVNLIDPQDKIIDTKKLEINDFGSIASEFVLPKQCLGGEYRININQAGITNSSTWIRVDEFVLPSFTLEWESSEKTYLPGDEVEIKGKIISYSGHNLSSATARYQLKAGFDTMAETALELDSNGNFSIKFTTEADNKSHYAYSVTISVSDSTGETWEFNNFVDYRTYLNLWLEAQNSAKGSFCLLGNSYQDSGMILNQDIAKIAISSIKRDIKYIYSLKIDNEIVETGICENIKSLELNFKNKKSGLYTLKLEAETYSDSGTKYTNTQELKILKALDTEKMLNSDVIGFFKEVEGFGLALQIGATGGPVWAVAELYGNGTKLLDKKIVKLIGKKGRAGSLQLVSFDQKDNYPSDLSFKILYFRDKNLYQYSKDFEKRNTPKNLPLEFSRFLDQTQPNKKYSFALQTLEDVEACASIFDISTEDIESNEWEEIWWGDVRRPRVEYEYSCGSNDSRVSRYFTKSAAYDSYALGASNSAISEESAVTASPNGPVIRQNMKNTIAWEPFLRSNKKGRIDIPFKTSDKLSSYAVQIFAHNKEMSHSVLRKDFIVTIPVKVSVSGPRYLYEGDSYTALMNVSNMLDTEIVGDVYIQFGEERAESQRVTLAPKSSIDYSSSISNLKKGNLDIIFGFRPSNNSYSGDAIKTSIDVKESAQIITESHSSLVFEDSDKNSIIENLRSQFVNATPNILEEVSIREMLDTALPKLFVPKTDDAQSVSSALYSKYVMTKEIDSNLVEKLLACTNKDGGFGWFPDMSSSPVITVQVLERLHFIKDKLPKEFEEIIKGAVKYLDKEFFLDKPLAKWRGGIDICDYLYIRSLYPGIEFDILSTKLKSIADFNKDAKNYLTPSKNRGLNAQIIEKARRALTLQNFINNPQSLRLFNTWGLDIRMNSVKKSLKSDIASLKEYAQKHSSGGIYFPNAVMPYRGLLDSELYAHSLLCNLFDNQGLNELSEGIRLWIMTQKETQNWSDDPSFVDALCTVLKGYEKTLNTKVIYLSGQNTLPFENIKASGNGFSIKTEYRIGGKVLQEGDTLKIGDKVIARHTIWSEENRSFVTMKLARPACLRPVVQTSGFYAWLYGAYRYVKSEESIYYFESFPEETFTINDEFYVVQEGVFKAPAPTIQSTYATHYRANGTMNQVIVK